MPAFNRDILVGCLLVLGNSSALSENVHGAQGVTMHRHQCLTARSRDMYNATVSAACAEMAS